MSLLYAVTCLLLGQRLNLGRGSKLLAIEDEVISRKHLQTFSAFFFFFIIKEWGGEIPKRKTEAFPRPIGSSFVYVFISHFCTVCDFFYYTSC